MRCRLYVITPPHIELAIFAPHFEAALAAGDVACVQLRLKDAGDDAIRRAAEALMPMARAHGAAFLINDRPDLAAQLGADGSHVGQDDMPYAQARAILGQDAIIGVTCHASRHLAMQAGEAGADYVAFGAFYPTATKQAKSRAKLEILAWWADLFEVPCVAIGGITPENARPLVEAGADFLAAANGIWNDPKGPAAAVARFNALFDSLAAG